MPTRYPRFMALAARLALVLALILVGSFYAFAQEAGFPGRDAFLARAVFAAGELWLLSDTGALFSITESASGPVEITFPDPALDLWVEDGQPAVIACRRPDCAEWTLRRRDSAGDWLVTTKVATQGDPLVAVARTATSRIVLTGRRIIDAAGDIRILTNLSHPLREKPVAATHVTPASIFVGFNMGEWGGGLQRIDRWTGEVVSIERKETGEHCFKPLDSDCDPVNGIATAPWDPNCVVLAIGVVHFAPHGRIVEVCGDTVRRLYGRALGGPPVLGRDAPSPGEDPLPSEAFFGLTRQGNLLWAVGIDGIYQIGSDKIVRPGPLPTFKQFGAFSISFDLPHVVLVLTQINRRYSISGSVPILVPR